MRWTMMHELARSVAQKIHNFEFDHVFVLHGDGTITEPPGVWAPTVMHSDENDIDIEGDGWRALTGLTGQYCYHGAVMHASEFVGPGIASYMLELVEDEPLMFTLVVVECWPEDDDPEPEPAGWAILYRSVP